jgi:L-lysine exporter family protein LysE/ArgO
MTEIIASALGFAALLALLPGPVFFALIQTSIQKTFKYAVFFALGVALSDILFILASYLGIANFITDEYFEKIIKSVGGAVLGLFGLFYFFKPADKKVSLEPIHKDHKKGNFFIKGFALNFLNPSTFFYWLALTSVVSVKYSDNQADVVIFFVILVGSIFGLDVMKSYLAHKIKKVFTNTTIMLLNKLLGGILILIGVNFLVSAFTGKALF